MRKLAYIGVVVVLAVGSFLLGRTINQPDAPPDSKYPYLAKRIFIDDPNDPFVNFAELRQQIQEYVTSNNLSGDNHAD